MIRFLLILLVLVGCGDLPDEGTLRKLYGIPIDKNSNDRTSDFNFSIGTSF